MSNNYFKLLSLLAALSFIVGLSMSSKWLSLVFFMIYVGGILVLVIFSTLCSSNLKVSSNPSLVLLLFLSVDGSSHYCASDLSQAIILLLLCILMMVLFLLVQLFKG